MKDSKSRFNDLKKDFGSIGARVQIIPYSPSSVFFRNGVVNVNVNEDQFGEFFEINVSKDMLKSLKVVRVESLTNHLILASDSGIQYLCGKFNNNLFIKGLNSVYSQQGKTNSFRGNAKKKPLRKIVRINNFNPVYRQQALMNSNYMI